MNPSFQLSPDQVIILLQPNTIFQKNKIKNRYPMAVTHPHNIQLQSNYLKSMNIDEACQHRNGMTLTCGKSYVLTKKERHNMKWCLIHEYDKDSQKSSILHMLHMY